MNPPIAVFSSQGVPAPDGMVTRNADVIFRHGAYDFPPEQGGRFEITPEDIERVCASFSPVEVEDTHHPSVFNGRLGHLQSVKPSADFQSFGGTVQIPRWLDSLFAGEPLKVSAKWDRATKTIKKLALVPNPRIEDAAMFAAFAADVMGGPPPKMDVDPPPPNGGGSCKEAAQSMMDLLAPVMSGDSSPEEKQTLQQIQDLLMSLGATSGATNPGSPGGMPGMPAMPPAMSKELQPYLERIRALEEANFAAQKAQFVAEGRSFAQDLFRSNRILPHEALTISEAYFQACMDDIQHPAEVCFSQDGAQKKGTRLQAFKAAQLARPQHSLTVEVAGDGKGTKAGEALFNQTVTSDPAKQPMADARKKHLMGLSPMGRAELRDRAKKSG